MTAQKPISNKKAMRFFIILCSLWAAFASAQPTSLNLNDLWTKGTFRTQRMANLKALKHSLQYTVLEFNRHTHTHEINLYDFATLSKVKTLFSGAEHGITRIDSYAFNEAENVLLIATQSEPIYRHSFVANYYLFDLRTGVLSNLTDKKIQEPLLSPNGKQVAFAYQNNLYLYDLSTQRETPITTDGQPNAIINGTADWVYEEEFGIVRLFQWNADGSQLAFVRFDERAVPEFSKDIYGQNLYPTQQRFKYPKAGEPNSVVSLWVYTLASNKNQKIALDAYYLPRLHWTPTSNKLCVQTLNRHQNHWQLLQVNTLTGQTTTLQEEKSNTYISVATDLTFLADGSFISPSEKDGYHHLYHYNAQGKLLSQLTRGNWEVTRFYGYNPKTNEVFFQSTEKGSTLRTLYAVDIKGKKKRCLADSEGTNHATFSGDFSLFIRSFSSHTTPPQYTLHQTRTGKELRTILNNQSLTELLQSYALPQKEFLTIETANGTFNAYMLKPTDFDPQKKYPLLMYQYSGPGSQEVANRWWDMNDYWHAMLTQKGYIVLCVDGRGTGYRGADFKKSTYLQLGKYEVADQTEVAKTVARYPYIDGNRIGIWGWSFGGFMASNCLFQHPEVFKMAIAVAPVTNWRFYDTIYTERFMRTPQENPQGYDDNSPITYASKLRGKYLLIHGSADDNVHVQNAMVLINALVSFQKDFDWRIYPDKDHGIYDNTGSTRYQLYTQMTNFILNNL